MKMKITKAISLLLCFAMTIGLLPTGAFFASAEDVAYTYSFVAADVASGDISYNGIPRYTEYPTEVYTEGRRNWKYHGMDDDVYSNWSTAASNNASEDGRNIAGFLPGGVKFKPAQANDWFTLQFRVPEAGLYKLSYIAPLADSSVYNSSVHIGVFSTYYTESILESTSSKTRDSSFYMADGINLNENRSASKTKLSYVDVGTNIIPINEAGGEAVISFTASTSDTSVILFRGFKLTKVSDELVLSHDEVILEEGGQTQKIITSLKNNTMVKSMGASFVIGDTGVATVKANGVITPVSAGWTTLTVTLGDTTKTIAVGVKDASGSVPGEKPNLEPELSFPKEFLHKGESVKITNANSSYTFASSDPSVATVSAEGMVTAVNLGSTTVTATKGDVVKTFEIPVVGENLINRNGIDHGHFENGINFSDGTDAAQGESLWEAIRRKEPSDLDKTRLTYYIYDYNYENVVLPGRNAAVNAIRLSFDEAPEGATKNTVEIQVPKAVQEGSSNRGMIALENGKIYEFTGWTAAQNTRVLADMWNAVEYFSYDGNSISSATIGNQTLKPWDNKSGDQSWQMFNSFPTLIDGNGSNTVLMRPIIKSISAAKIGDILMTEFSVHEVIYDRMELAAEKTEISGSEIVTLSAKHLSNTGNLLKRIENGKQVDINVPVTYVSDKTDVVRVIDDKGTIIGVGDGIATITATATIGGVTVSEEIEITVSGGERPEFIGSIELAIQGENIYPASYVSTMLTVKSEEGETMTLSSDEIAYESSNTEVATVTSNGVVRAKTAGTATITVTAKKNGLTKTATALLTVLPLPQEENFPEVIGAYFTTDHTYVDGENSIVVTDFYGRKLGGGVTYEYEIADDNIITQSNGTFIGKKIGRTTVKISATFDGVTRYTEVPAVVVGNNLLIRKGVNHGEFENGIYLNDGSTDTVKDSSFWTGAHTASRGLFGYEILRNQFSGILGAPATPTNIIKFTMPDGETADMLKLIRIQGSQDVYNESGTKHTGVVIADSAKLYEFSGYIKAENVADLPENACGNIIYLNGSGSSATELKNYKSTPWVGKSGDQDWTKFNVAPVLMNWPSVKQFTLRPGFEALTDDKNRGYELSVAHLSLHEVVFDSIAFAANGDFSNAKTYDTFETTAKLLSNTGAEILPGNINDPIVITYTSDDENVARISEDGIITAVSSGTTKVHAYATVLGITKTAEIEVTFSELDVMFDRVDVSVDTEFDVGDTAQIIAIPKNTDDSQFTGEVEIYFESTNTAVATVSKNGVINARKSGETEINVYAILGERRVKTTVKIIVNDTTPLDTVKISGADTVEEGFTLKLSAEAIHESGSAADMSESVVAFELAPGADENILSVTEDGIVTGKAVGTASVIASVTAKNGSSKTSEPFNITVVPQSPKSKIFDFTKYPLNTSVLNQTIEDDGFEINRDLSSTAIVSGVLNSLRYLRYGINSKVSATGHTQNADTVLDIKIDYDGWYEIDFKGAKINSGAGLAYIYMDGTYLGEYCFYNETDIADIPAINLNTIYLKAGTHQFTLRSIESGEDGTMAAHTRGHAISEITFRYLTETPEICSPVMTSGKYAIAVGESVDLDVQVPLSNGRTHSFGNRQGNTADSKSNLKITSDNTNVVRYENGKLIAVSEGTALITAKALVYEAPSESAIEITVTDEKLTKVENLGAEKISLYVGDSADIELRAFVKGENSEEREIAISNLAFTYELVGGNVAEVAGGKITATAVGDATLAVTATLGNAAPITSYIPVTVLPDGFASATLDAVTQTVKFGGEGTDLIIKAYDNFGKEIDVSSAEVSYTVNDTDILIVDENGRVTPGKEGVAEISATVTIDGITHTTNTLTVSVRKGKVGSTYYTPERVSAARENIKKYDWAKSEAKAAIEKADKFLPYVEFIYNMVTNHTIPRTVYLGEQDDPDIGICMYCGTDVYHKYGGKNSWTVNAISRPWKIQCAECKRIFPSNDFGKFYENGLDEHGEFDRTLALENNGILCGRGERNEKGEYVVYDQYVDNPYGYGDPKGNLYNKSYIELYPESALDPRAKKPITQGWGDFKVGGDSGVPSAGYFWGVDDGLGYDTGRVHQNGVKEIHRYVGLFNYAGIWYWHGAYDQPIVYASLTSLRDAYLYTGDKKYGIAGAIILDRVADLYPDFNYGVDCANLVTSGNGRGKISGYIHENFVNRPFTTGYDAFFDCYDEPEVINFLSRYAEKWNLDNKKTNGELIRQNVEENILMETYYATARAWIRGNFGMKQETVTKAATILDREPDTSEMIDFVMRSGTLVEGSCTGCDLYKGIMNDIDRDGYGNEGSLPYNAIFSSSFVEVINTLSYYGKVKGKYDLINNPKVIASFTLGADTILAGMHNANIGDHGSGFGSAGITGNQTSWLLGLQHTDNPIFAQLLYLTNGNSAEGLKYDIFTKDPESPEKVVEEIVKEYGEFDLSKSDILTGYGFAALRDGVLYNDVTSTTQANTMRDWWMYFGGGSVTTHKHMDILNLGIDAFGLNMAPDLGYGGSGDTANQGNNTEYWYEGTISHNTVMVNDTQQSRFAYSFPLHFEDAGSVKVMDVDAAQAYEDITDIYRRTVVSVDVDDSVSYALDFFRIKGGEEHLYSFHSQSEESTVTGVELVRQPQGTYAGIDVEPADIYYTGTDGFNNLKNVEKAAYPENKEFSIDFKITDYHKILPGRRDLHLKLTQLNDFEVSEVVLADGFCIEDARNPETTDYLLVRRSGNNLDTLFTSVIEPYEDASKIKSLARVDVVRKDGGEIRENDAVAAVKVELVNGRVDYVVYSARNDVEYRVADLFDFTGFVGVYSVNANDSTDVVRTYINDGTKIGDTTAEYAAVTGTVVDFTDYLNYEDGKPVLDNYIEVTAQAGVKPESLVGKMIVVDNDGGRNGAYVIKSAEVKGDNILLGTGDVNFFRSLAEDNESFVWNIERGQSYRIPMSVYTDVAPKISVSGTFSTSAGSAIKIPLNVESEREYTLIATSLPRGMTLNEETGVLTWKPSVSQIGENHVAVTVDNGVLSDTVHFTVMVYGNTTGGSSSDKAEAPSNGSTDTPISGGDNGSVSTDKPGINDTDKTDGNADGEKAPDASGGTDKIRFIDLGNHAWASEAINALADDGIIKGTTATTFSPAANITRADFALLLVRAFKLESENTENFADVDVSDYFARELAIARNVGIVGGIGENKYAPRNNITRQDMMVIVYRALKKLNVEFGENNEPQYEDIDVVADYAKEAVSALVGAGLVNGKSGRIAPLDYTTRAEVAVLIKRILDYIK